MLCIMCISIFLLLMHFVVFKGHIWFGYKGNEPANWGSLSPDYKTCSMGTHQSPINIAKDDISLQNKFHYLDRRYVNANATLVNNGYNIMVCTAYAFMNSIFVDKLSQEDFFLII